MISLLSQCQIKLVWHFHFYQCFLSIQIETLSVHPVGIRCLHYIKINVSVTQSIESLISVPFKFSL